ncbi:gamma-butyrobetaine hydroxylase-like domain-containing protein [Chthonobacter rhizosphaerae]|uniref:gamma-butyrobetaine hydroxylase-like domain-containing protein n=1 Tax=Chthonobacter rhizosphaerae TaxID=2735553 RepID=UPI0015EEB0B3|nr:DUF971 domain-containing protein [Chthonobacter rhizosphaerae]
MSDKAWPTEIRLSPDKRTLTVAFDDGKSFAIPAELLRVRSPSAEVQGHGPGQRQTVPGKREVQILAVEPVGSYAVRLRFDDMHDTGIYPWDLLRDMGERQDALLAEYVAELDAKGMSRERRKR